jgi:hypothetical protein
LKPWRWVTTFFSSTLGAAAGLAATGFTTAFGAVFGAAFEVAVFAAAIGAVLAVLDVEVLAVLDGIALLLFFEDFAAAAALPAVRVSRARLLDALRLAAAAFLDGLEVLFLRVFCDTACARNCHAPVRWVFAETL